MDKRVPFYVWWIVAAGILLSALVWVFFVVQIREEREEAIRAQAQHNTNLAVIFAEQAIATVEDVDGLLLDMRRIHAEKGRATRLDEVPTPLALTARALVYRAILDREGKIVVGLALPDGADLAEREYFKLQKAATTDKLVVGNAVVGWTTGRQTVHISRRITNPDGSFGGVVVVGLDPNIFTELYKKVDMGDNGHIAFVGFDGQLRARRLGESASFGGDASGNLNLRKILAEKDQVPSGSLLAPSGVDGVSRVIAFKIIPSLAMVVIVATTSQEALEAAGERAEHYTSIAIGATVLLLMLAVALSAVFTHQHKHTRQIETLNHSLEQRIEARTRDLQEANQRLEAFSYSVSHDLRGPLTTIDGFSGLLLRRKSLQADQPSLSLVGRIRSGVGQMTLLIDGLLSLATLARGKVHREPVNLSIIAKAILKQYTDADARRVVEIHIQDNMVVQADSRLMTSVLNNLIANAWKFSAGTPAPRIEVGSQAGADGKTIFFVRDNGAGFDMAHAGKLFQVFERLHTASQFEGTGIGLATVKQVIEMHRGEVWAESAPGGGGYFLFHDWGGGSLRPIFRLGRIRAPVFSYPEKNQYSRTVLHI
jgi:signal transduction histidine kinase